MNPGLKPGTLDGPEVAAEHERPDGGTLAYCGGKRSAQLERRRWRAETRTTKPLSAKVRHEGGKVDVVAAPKKGRGK